MKEIRVCYPPPSSFLQLEGNMMSRAQEAILDQGMGITPKEEEVVIALNGTAEDFSRL